jgi:probable HAF family extracellular repeat protein
MSIRLRVSGVFAALVAAVGLALAAEGAGAAAVSAKPQWVIRDLGTWLGGKHSWAAAVNDRGQVVVLSETAQTVEVGDQALPVMRAFLWEKGRMRDLGVAFRLRDQRGPGSWAATINERGQVVGQADTKAIAKSGHNVTHAFLWEDGKVRDLGAFAPGESSAALDVNERGQIVGASCRDIHAHRGCRTFLWENGKMTDLGTPGSSINERGQIVGTGTTGALDPDRRPIRRAFLWQKGKLTDLGTLGGPNSGSSAINDRGQVVGQADTTAKYTGGYLAGWPIGHAFLWQNGKMRDLGTLGGESSRALAINERGQVVGQADTKTGSHAFLWSTGRMRDLGSFGGLTSEPRAINERGQVVGVADTTATDKKGNPIRHAFLWQNGRLIDLGTLGGSSEAVAINERGQIIGWSETKSGAAHAVLWTASSGR